MIFSRAPSIQSSPTNADAHLLTQPLVSRVPQTSTAEVFPFYSKRLTEAGGSSFIELLAAVCRRYRVLLPIGEPLATGSDNGRWQLLALVYDVKPGTRSL